MPFKIGDNVRIVNREKLGNHYLEIGSIHTLSRKGHSVSSQIWFLDNDGPFNCVFEAGLELVEELKVVHHEGWVRVYEKSVSKVGIADVGCLVYPSKKSAEEPSKNQKSLRPFTIAKIEWDEEVTQSVDRDNLAGLDWTDEDFI